MTYQRPMRPGAFTEQPRLRDSLTERLMRANLWEMADRTAPLPVHSEAELKRALSFFGAALLVEHLDWWEPGWEQDSHIQRGRY